MALFVLQGIYFAFAIKFGTPPDETYHLTYIKFFTEILPSPFPTHQGGYDILQGAVSNPFFIYHYLMAFPYKLISGFSNAYIVLRLISLAFGVGSLFVVARIAEITKISSLARNLSVFMLANTLMYIFIFSAVSYDGMFILLSLLSMLLVLRICKKKSLTDMLLLLICLAAGMLTKINFIPIGLMLLVVFIYIYFKSPISTKREFIKLFNKSKRLNIFLMVLLVFLSVIFVQRYIFNEVRYGSFNPPCQKVRTLEECRKSALFTRNEKIYSFNHPHPNLNIVEYTKKWVPLMENRTYGIFAHKYFDASNLIQVWSTFLLSLLFVLSIVYRKRVSKEIKLIFVVSVLYISAVFIENLHTYHSTGRMSLAVHGRYIFSALPIIYLVLNHLVIDKQKSKKLILAYSLLTIIVFCLTAFPVFVTSATDVWFR
jgi:hypothetical protein